MSDPVIRYVRRAIEDERNRGGMKAGMPKVTIDASHAERLCIMAEQLQQAEARVAELEADAKRYRFFRDNQAWRRVAPRPDDPGYDFIGLKFEIHNGFTARVYLDHAIDQCLRQQADELDKAGGNS